MTTFNPSPAQWTQYPNQSFNLTDIYDDPVTVSLADIRLWMYQSATEVVAYGVAIGLCSTLLIVLITLALDDHSKLRRPIFLLNILSLFLISCRGIVQGILVSGPFGGFAQRFLGAPALYPNTALALNIISSLTQAALYASILSTLTLQVRVVFSSTKKVQKVITIVLSVAGLALFSLELTGSVFYILYIIADIPDPEWLPVTIRTFFVIFVGSCSLIFLYKLSILIHQRRKIGITKVGPLQILFITSCQCLVAPRKPTLLIPN